MNKNYKILLLLGLIVVLFTIIGCEYDVKSPLYYSTFEDMPVPKINSVIPADVAMPGANHIVIQGENFADAEGKNLVYFDGKPVDVLDFSTSSLTVRRPDLVSDAAMIKVVSYDALVVSKFGPYKIDPVVEAYGLFIEGAILSAFTVDKDETIYMVQRVPATVLKVPVEGEKSELGTASRIVTDVKIGPEGQLILLMNNKAIMQMNVMTGEETEWVSVPKKVSFGDFDRYGNFYASGTKSDLAVVKPDLTSSLAGFYAADKVFCLRVYNDALYVLAEIAKPEEGAPALGIWKHAIQDANGTLSEGQLVLDWATTGAYSETTPLDMTFSEEGLLYIATNHTNPVFILNPDGTQDILYKDILTSTAEKIVWGNGSYLYQITGGDDWNLMRIDMGAEGAPYFGR